MDERTLTDAEKRKRICAVQQALRPYRRVVLASEELIAERRLEAWKETIGALHDSAELARRHRLRSTSD